MEINYLGHASFKITGKNITIVCDPFDPEKVGLKFSKLGADVVLISHNHPDHNNKEKIKGDFLLFNSPGEYEFKEYHFQGTESYHDEKKGEERGKNTIFTMEIDNIKICHLGDIGTELSSQQLEDIDGVDVLMIPVGGNYTIDAKEAVKIISDIESKLVIPMHYKAGKMKELASIDEFLSEIGEEPEVVERLKINKKDLPDDMKVVVFK